MQTIINFFKRALKIIQRRFTRVFDLLETTLRRVFLLLQRGTFALPHDETEKLQVLEFIFKTLNLILALSVLVAGVWLADHKYPSWLALTLLALRLLYTLPAKRVERALRQRQYQDRERARMMRRP